MAEDIEDAAAAARGTDPLAAHLAMNAASEEARDYLRKQGRLADLQIDTLEKKDEFELSHLRFRRFSDYARFSLEVAGFLVVLLIVSGLGAMVWSAVEDHDLVVDAFSVPPDVAQSGMTGAVLAGRVLDRFGRMEADTVGTLQAAGSVRRDSTEEVRVEIPDTGVSLGELSRYLRGWLGHETHVTGDLVRTAKGLALTVRYGAEPGATEESSAGDLNTLIEKSAEHVYASARPYRYAEYLAGKKRFDEALAIAPGLAARGTAPDRALAYLTWGTVLFRRGDMAGAVAKDSESVRLDPDNPLARAWLSAAQGNLGHDEPSYLEGDAAIRQWRGPVVAKLDADEVAMLPVLFTAYRDELDGDFPSVLEAWAKLAASGWGGYDSGQHAQDAASDHDLRLARHIADLLPAKMSDGKPSWHAADAQFAIAAAAGDWAGAVRWGVATNALLDARPNIAWNQYNFLWPSLAYAMARNGDMPGAQALIAKTPLDCDFCMRMRGRLAALKRDWPGAARDFAVVSARTPHSPFADTDWGRMLLAKGDLDGAISKFESAHSKSPHFADPLEMWGEALIAKNRSDLALAKFEEASTYAPNWGRLHLKWGEALFWSGKREGARRQFAVAGERDLSVAEKAELARQASADR